jgi:hypothetical protein
MEICRRWCLSLAEEEDKEGGDGTWSGVARDVKVAFRFGVGELS